MNKTMRPKASELGIWKAKTDGVRWSWLNIEADEIVLVDKRAPEAMKHKVRQCGSTFRLEIIESDEMHDGGYRVTTCGTNGKGATRHREFKTNLEAQKYAIKWLDYRIAVCVA